jgi:hypothetical protein
MRRLIAAFLVGLLVHPQLVSAQSLTPGTRVRFSHPGEGTRTGTVVYFTADTLDVRLSDRAEPVHLPVEQLTRLDVSRGMQRQPLRRAGVGFVVGATLGSIGAALTESNCDSRGGQNCLGAGGGALIGGIFYGAFGGVLGLVAGVIPSEKWDPVPIETRRISLVAPPAGSGRGVGLRFAF